MPPSNVRLPVTSGVRPTAVAAPMLASSSSTRYPTNELEKSENEPTDGSTFHVPSSASPAVDPLSVAVASDGSAAVALGEAVATSPSLVASGVGVASASPTAAGAAGRRKRYEKPIQAPTTTARASATRTRRGQRRRSVADRLVLGVRASAAGRGEVKIGLLGRLIAGELTPSSMIPWAQRESRLRPILASAGPDEPDRQPGAASSGGS